MGFSRYIGQRTGDPRSGRESLKGLIFLAVDGLILFIFLFCISTQILYFEDSYSLSPGPQSCLVPPWKIFLGGPVVYTIFYLILDRFSINMWNICVFI